MQYRIGDKVFVIDWGKKYSKIGDGNGVFEWNTPIPNYSSIHFFWEYEYEDNLTLKGTINKREPKKLKSKTPAWKNFKWEIVEVRFHPKAGEISTDWRTPEKPNADVWYHPTTPIYLLKSPNRCFVEVGEEGLSLLTPEQYADEQFNALKAFHKGKWSPSDHIRAQKEFPEELLGVVYDKDDRVLFGSGYTRGKVKYTYIPAEYMTTGNPYIIYTSIDYDGKGNSDIPKDAIIKHFHELPAMFPDNQFS